MLWKWMSVFFWLNNPIIMSFAENGYLLEKYVYKAAHSILK